MAGMLPGETSHHGVHEGGKRKVSQDEPEENGGSWYFLRKEIEEKSPSRQDGIDLKKETYLRKSYCTFLQDLGMRLKVPQVTIATAIIFCHHFFLRQSHAKNDRRTIATVCMFVAGKVEETPRPLKDVIMVSYEIIHKKDPAAAQRIKQKEVYEQQKELILLGERIVLATLAFDLNVHHPYKPLVEAIKKFKVAQNTLAQVAWNFVNDGLRTSLCLQFKPHHIAAGAIFLAAKFLKVKLPSDGEKVWWQEFDVTPRQLEEVSNQMLELYEQNRVPPSQASEAEGSAEGCQRPPSKAPAASEDRDSSHSNSHGGVALSRAGTSKPVLSRPSSDQPLAGTQGAPPRIAQTRDEYNEYGTESHSISDYNGADEINNTRNHERENKSRVGYNGHAEGGQEGNAGGKEMRNAADAKGKYCGRSADHRDGTLGRSPQDVIKKIDKDKLRAAIEKRKKAGAVSRKPDSPVDDDDYLERAIEEVEMPSESENINGEKKQMGSKVSHRPEFENAQHVNYPDEARERHYQTMKGQSPHADDFDNIEEGELETFDDAERGYVSPRSVDRKRKAGSPLDKSVDHDHHDLPDNRGRFRWLGYAERDHKRHVQENHA